MTRRAYPVPRLDPDIARLAGALADPSRIAMLDALLDGSAQPIGALARRAGISAATAIADLALARQWVVRVRDSRALRLTARGRAALAAELGATL